ncbi:MAG: AAA family ATPase, partial [Prevotella sp.]|nr:AAA family ATPase [Candidatus Prevotella equi]
PSAMEYLRERLNMTQIQIIVLAFLIEDGVALSWRDLAQKLNVPRLTMMTYSDEVEELVNERRWLRVTMTNQRCQEVEAYMLRDNVINSIRHNEVYEPESLDGYTEQTLVERLGSVVDNMTPSSSMSVRETQCMMMDLVRHNPELPISKAVLTLDGSIFDKYILLFLVADYAMYGETDQEGITSRDIDNYMPNDWECGMMRRSLASGKHMFFVKEWIEYYCEDGIANFRRLKLTQKGRDTLIPGFTPTENLYRNKSKASDRDLVSFMTIKPKHLYYNTHEQEQVNRLRHILDEEHFREIQQRLSEEGMRTGVAVLLNGGPGTGKTELVRQLARETERNLLMIDISRVKDKFVGESEKNTKAIFERYKRLCKNADKKPILFINECDAILGKRLEKVDHSSDKMLNSMQNILLQELEDFEGIMICTTNMAEKGLDEAFMRRFLIKIAFNKPDADVRAHIWQSMLTCLTDEEAYTLALRYDFSGGQCENVLRKATIEHIVNGTPSSFEQIDLFCQEETEIQKSSQLRHIAGFSIAS